MKRINIFAGIALLTVILSLSSCEVVGGIFKAGMGFGIFIVVAIIVVIALIMGRASRNK